MSNLPDSEPGDRPSIEDAILRTQGRRAFVLAFHLIGSRSEAETLALGALGARCLAPAGFDPEARVDLPLHRKIVELWMADRRRARPGAGPEPHEHLARLLARLTPEARAALVLRVADDLDHESIAMILATSSERVRGLLVKARTALYHLARGRRLGGRLHGNLPDMVTLYLDGSLPAAERADFERRLEVDREAREAVEFHRGLTLEFQEEVPPLPRGFDGRAREHVLKARAGIWRVPPAASRMRAATAIPIGIAVLVLAAAGIQLYLTRQRAAVMSAAVVPGAMESGDGAATAPGGGSSDGRETADDLETLEALRSLGYLAGGSQAAPASPDAAPSRAAASPPSVSGAGPRAAEASPGSRAPAAPVAGAPPANLRDRGTAASAPAEPSAVPARPPDSPEDPAGPAIASVAPPGASGAAAAPDPIPETVPETAAEPAQRLDVPAAPAASGAATTGSAPAAPATGASASSAPAPGGPSPGAPGAPSLQPAAPGAPPEEPASAAIRVPFRTVPLTRPPELGLDHQIVQSRESLAALLDPTAAPPAVEFAAEMIVVVKEDLGGEPRSVLRVLSVISTDRTLDIVCRVERWEPGSAPPLAGRGVIVPLTEHPVRVLIR